MLKNTTYLFKQTFIASAIAASLSAPSVYAQGETFVMEEVLVTASKREKTLQETPIAVFVTSAETIERANILDTADLTSVVPTLRITPAGTRSASVRYSIRGLGNGGSNGTEPSVGVFIDGVYRARSGSIIGDLPRLQRIEVLSGPQSTLFGKNASAGAISIITMPPSQEFEAKVEAGIGNYNQQILKGYVTGGITDDIAMSFSAGTNQRDGYSEGRYGFSDLNDRDRWNVRSQLLYTPTEDFSLRIIADYSEIDEVCCTVANVINGAGVTAVINGLAGEQAVLDASGSFDYKSLLDFDPTNAIEDGGISFHADIDFEDFTLTSITAYRFNEITTTGDIDFTALDIASSFSTPDVKTFSQEIRLTSTSDGPVSWIVGGSLSKEEISTYGYTLYGDDLRPFVNSLIGGILPYLELITGTPSGGFYTAGTKTIAEAGLDTDSYSIFGTMDYNINDKLTATLGLNYTQDDRESSAEQIDNPDLFGQVDWRTLNPFGRGEALAGLAFRPQGLSYPNEVEDGKSSDDDVTWLARLNYEISDNVNVYVSAATGFKSSAWEGGKPNIEDQAAIEAAGIDVINQTYGSRKSDPEYSTVYEIGIKSSFNNGSVNIAIFDQSIEDFQTRGFDGVNFINLNAGEISVQGVEFDILYAPSANWLFTMAGTYLDPEYIDYKEGVRTTDDFGTEPYDRSGTRPGGIHSLALSTAITYSFMLDNGANGYVRGDYLHESDTEISDSFPGLSREVGTFNASAGLLFDNGVGVKIWGRNLNNDEYLQGGFSGVAQRGTVNSWPNQPRTYGATVSYEF